MTRARLASAAVKVDNYGRPRSEYLDRIKSMTDAELRSECYSMIYHSARCNNNPRADWHWMVDACYSEAKTRHEDGRIYVSAYDECYRDHAS